MAALSKKLIARIPNAIEDNFQGLDESDVQSKRLMLPSQTTPAIVKSNASTDIELTDPFSYWFQCKAAN